MIYILFVNGATLRSGVFTLTAIIQQNLIPFFLADFLFILLFFFGRLLPFLQIRRQMKTLRNGSFPEIRIRRIIHSGYCHFGVFLCLVVMVFYNMTIVTYTTPEEELAQQGHVPFVTLESIEGLPPNYPIDYSKYEPIDYPDLNDYLYFEDYSMLAPRQFILRQDEERPFRDKDNPAYLWMHYIEVSLPFLAEPLYQERIEELLPEDAIPVNISADIDKMQVYDTSEGTYFFLLEGNKTLCIHHVGTGDPLPYTEYFIDFLKNDDAWPFLPDEL